MSATLPATLAAPPAGLTYEEFLEWAPEGLHAEWIDGEIITMSPASSRHQLLSGFLQSLLKIFCDVHQLGEVLTAPFQMKTSPRSPGREPDLIFVARENLGRIQANYLAGPADLAIEIISPESRTRDTIDTFHEYAEGGVREYWLIDPARQEATFHALVSTGTYEILPTEADVVRSAVLPGLRLDVAWLWANPLPPLPTVLAELGLRIG